MISSLYSDETNTNMRTLLSLVTCIATLGSGCTAVKTNQYPIKEREALLKHVYTADPSAHVFNDKLYVYASHDQSGESPYTDPVDKFDMKDYFVMSMDENLQTVTQHDVALQLEDIPWAKRQLWAPDAAYANGKYYFYFPAKAEHGEFEIGVAVGDQPEGPFIPEANPIKGSYSIDPAVFKDDDGAHYMYFGGIGGGFLHGNHDTPNDSILALPAEQRPATAPRVARLKENMVEFAEEPKSVLLLDTDGSPLLAGELDRRFFEAAWVHQYNGKYYFSYSTGETHFIVYAVGDSPYGPFTYQGKVLEPVVGWTNHHSIVKYKGEWYLFYHDSVLSGGVTHQRTVKFTKLKHNEDGSIETIKP